MSRDLTSQMQAALGSSLVRPNYFYEFEFGETTVRLWSGYGDYTWDGHTWLGNGWLRSFNSIEETVEIQAAGLSVRLSGIPDELIELILNDARPSNEVTIWLALFDSARAVIANPAIIFKGKLDVPEIADSEEDSNVTITYESELIRLEQARDWRYTRESQQALFAGDKGFDYTPTIEDWSGFWGRRVRESAQKRRGKAKKRR